ncbi:MAG: DUF5615 family PIN-like protein [Pseudomonadota bacterium]
MKFLIDECLSPELATLARARGFGGSTHVTWLGLGGRPDWDIARRAVDDGFVFVTNNNRDFLALYRREELHAGLVCLTIEPSVRGIDMQLAVFTAVLAELADEEPYSGVLDVQVGKDRNVVASRYHWAAASTSPPKPAGQKTAARRKS